jgi:citrate lyase beta subunit
MTEQFTVKREFLPYSVGALMYTPAVNTRIAARLCGGTYSGLSSLVFCFEDALMRDSAASAEEAFIASLEYIDRAAKKNAIHTPEKRTPFLFIRVYSAEHLIHVCSLIAPYRRLITGFVLPKYDTLNASEYEKAVTAVNVRKREAPFFVMPTLESEDVIYKEKRLDTLGSLKKYIDAIAPYILNVRVGGNDFCRIYGLRRQVTQTIYDISVVRDVLADIINVFSRDYVVSAPVWEYFDTNTVDTLWKEGLRRELELDRLNGFIGKTAVHPSQLPVIAYALKVSRADYEDAFQIMNWKDEILGVSRGNGRMNELNTHRRWAEKILLLAEIYGIADEAY